MRRIRRIASLGLRSAPAAMAPRADRVAQGKPLIRDHKPNNKARQANEQRNGQHHSTAADELFSRTGVEIRPGFADGLNLSKSTVASALPPTPAQSIGKVHELNRSVRQRENQAVSKTTMRSSRQEIRAGTDKRSLAKEINSETRRMQKKEAKPKQKNETRRKDATATYKSTIIE